MKYQVPQFIEIEDKIFGPLTLKQFIYIAGGIGLSMICYLFLPKIIAFLFILPVMGFSLALAFYKINNKPFVFVIESAAKYLVGTKLYIWKKEEAEPEEQTGSVSKSADNALVLPKLADSKLKEMTWSLGVKDALNPVTQDDTTA